MSGLKVFIDTFASEGEACFACPILGFIGPEKNSYSICRLAELEFILGRIPTHQEAGYKGLETGSISANCPNRYRGYGLREVR